MLKGIGEGEERIGKPLERTGAGFRGINEDKGVVESSLHIMPLLPLYDKHLNLLREFKFQIFIFFLLLQSEVLAV